MKVSLLAPEKTVTDFLHTLWECLFVCHMELLLSLLTRSSVVSVCHMGRYG